MREWLRRQMVDLSRWLDRSCYLRYLIYLLIIGLALWAILHGA